MNDDKPIHSALISVFYKEGIEKIVEKFDQLNIKIYSTGGTYKYITDSGFKATKIETLTSYPSIMGGRLKTLHPKVFGAILHRGELDEKERLEYKIPVIDVVIVCLYPFEKTVSQQASQEEIIEKIDIGGISLIRAAAKNCKEVVVISSPQQYQGFLQMIEKTNGTTSLRYRKELAIQAFHTSSSYDASITNYFNESILLNGEEIKPKKTLRYGENPHQKGHFLGNINDIIEQIHGKELSYNNLLDVDAAVEVIKEFAPSIPTFAILKHTNVCGIASCESIKDAYCKARDVDPISSFGSILIANKTIDVATAEQINKLFFEVIIAPSYEEKALYILQKKKNRIILILKQFPNQKTTMRSVLNGVLIQDKDVKTDTISEESYVTEKRPTPAQLKDLLFASKICKHTKSNAIVLVKNLQLLSSGVGQTSRIDCVYQAIKKAENFKIDIKDAVMASDAFFPFPDCVEVVHRAGITSIIQPGGSIRDGLSTDYCNEKGISMVVTGIRHFKH